MSDTAILTLYDFERIKKNAKFFTKEEEKNSQKVLYEQQECKQAKAKALKDKLIDIDKRRLNKYEVSDIDRENIDNSNSILHKAKKILENNEDNVKEMNQFVLYAKIASIRDKQLIEQKALDNIYKKKEQKQDIMMELERLKELKHHEERERRKKIQQKEGSLIIIDQIKERELERLREKELIAKEGIEIVKKIKYNEEEDRRKLEKKRIKDDQMNKEIDEFNKQAAFARDQKKLEEKDLDIKILRYNMEKVKKEEDEIVEKKRIRDAKEKETQMMREKQEKVKDKQSELDALRAKRSFEEQDRRTREKEKQELIKKRKIIEDLLNSNERQKIDKELKIAEQAKQEQMEHEKIITKQIADLEEERRREEEKKKKRYEHNFELRKQIKIKEENEKMLRRSVLEEGRSIKQQSDLHKAKMDAIKKEKIKELQSLNVNVKYIADLERYKIK